MPMISASRPVNVSDFVRGMCASVSLLTPAAHLEQLKRSVNRSVKILTDLAGTILSITHTSPDTGRVTSRQHDPDSAPRGDGDPES